MVYEENIVEKGDEYINKKEYEILEKTILNNEICLEEKIYKLVKFICEYIEEDDTDSDVIKTLAILLRKKVYDDREIESIIGILDRYIKTSKKIRAKNIFLNEKEILEKKSILESKPRHITVELTTRCNINCIMCGFSNIENKYKYKTISDTFISFFKQNISCFERVVWQGGEPFFYNQIYDLIDLANRNKVYQQISTNFLLVNENKLEQLCNKNISLFISIDGITKNIYEKIRIGGSFDALLKKLDKLKKYKKSKKNKTIMAVVIMPINFTQIDDMVKFAIEYNFDEIVFQKYMDKRNIDLNLDKNQLDFVVEKISLYEVLSLNNEIPIRVSSSFETKKDLCKIKEQKNGVEFKKIGERLSELTESLQLKDKSNEDKDYHFCYAPWTNLCLYTNNVLKIACNSRDVKFTEKDIWNNEEFIKYRQMIINKNLQFCNKECANRGAESFSIKMGI